MIIAILIALCASVLIFDFKKNLKASPKWEKALYLVLLFTAIGVLALHELGVPIPSPAQPIETVLKPLVSNQ